MNTKRPDKLELKYIDQKYDGLEAWIRYGDSEWIRLDFILEYYLFKNVDLTKEYKGQLNDKKKAKEYIRSFYLKFSRNTSRGSTFDFKKYINWIRFNQSEVSKIRKLLCFT